MVERTAEVAEGAEKTAENAKVEKAMGIRVIKIGGSLFAGTDLPSMLSAWLNAEPPSINVAITGGGVWADAVRQLDGRWQLAPVVAHRLAIRAMSLTAWTLSHWMPSWLHCDTFSQLRAVLAAARPSGTIVFDPAELLERHEPLLPGTPLTIGWQVTSDSIAARLAEILAADELVLLKSAPTDALTPTAAAQCGYVDGHFPRAAENLPRVRCVALPVAGDQRIWQGRALRSTTTSDRLGGLSDRAPRPHGA